MNAFQIIQIVLIVLVVLVLLLCVVIWLISAGGGGDVVITAVDSTTTQTDDLRSTSGGGTQTDDLRSKKVDALIMVTQLWVQKNYEPTALVQKAAAMYPYPNSAKAIQQADEYISEHIDTELGDSKYTKSDRQLVKTHKPSSVPEAIQIIQKKNNQ